MTRKPLLLLLTLLCSTLVARADETVSVSLTGGRVATLNNGTVSLTINAKGRVTSCLYDGTELIQSGSAFYFSCNQPDYAELDAAEAEVLVNSADMAEVVYRQTAVTAGIRWSQGFIVRRGVSGFYSYLIAEGTGADNSLGEARMVYRLSDNLFDYGYVNEQMQGTMPNAAEMTRSEERQVQDATFRLDDGTIYTKYNWANYVKDDHFHGLLSTAAGIGAWSIPVSTEYINGGPMRQDLTVHATDQSPLILQMLHGTHFGAGAQQFADGTRKIYGPFFFYLNKGTKDELIADAAREATAQEQAWPFQWFSNDLYDTQRITVTGLLQLHTPDAAERDSQSAEGNLQSPTFRVVLSQPGSDVYDQGDGYIFWAETAADGSFSIPNVRPGAYTLTAYALSGGLTEQFSRAVTVVGGSPTDNSPLDLGTLNWYPAYYGPELWRIGESNRLSDGFKLSDAPRAYELNESVPADLTFTIGSSDVATDWYYAQTKVGTWTIRFTLPDKPYGPARLTATAAGAANVTRMNFSVNGGETVAWTLVSDGSVYRSAVLGGRYQQFTLDLPAGTLTKGENTITLELTDHNYATSGIAGVMWDCIKLEQSCTETYDFTGLGNSSGLLPTWGDDVNCGGQTLQLLANSATAFGNRFACGPKRGDDNVFKFRDSGTYHGLYSQYSDRYLSVLNLEQGDRVTIMMKADRAALAFSGAPIVEGANSGGAVENGKTYTISEAGHLNLVTTGETYIEQIVIERYAPVAPVTVELGPIADGATLVSSEALDFTDLPVNAYIATKAEAGVVTFTRVEKVPANTPVFLKADVPVAIDVPTLSDETEADDVSANLLQGSATMTTTLQSTSDVRYYVYGTINGVAGFYPVSTTNVLTSAAGKAYLRLDAAQTAGARSIAMRFVDEVQTAIEQISRAQQASDCYTLQGMRVERPTKRGLYIIGGKKVFVK